jgi:hypothetical protein
MIEAVNAKNSAIRIGLNASGAVTPGKSGSIMIAAICT